MENCYTHLDVQSRKKFRISVDSWKVPAGRGTVPSIYLTLPLRLINPTIIWDFNYKQPHKAIIKTPIDSPADRTKLLKKAKKLQKKCY